MQGRAKLAESLPRPRIMFFKQSHGDTRQSIAFVGRLQASNSVISVGSYTGHKLFFNRPLHKFQQLKILNNLNVKRNKLYSFSKAAIRIDFSLKHCRSSKRRRLCCIRSSSSWWLSPFTSTPTCMLHLSLSGLNLVIINVIVLFVYYLLSLLLPIYFVIYLLYDLVCCSSMYMLLLLLFIS